MVWRDGELVAGGEPATSSKAAWGAFTTVGCDGGRPLLWPRHRRRLAATLDHLGVRSDHALPTEEALCRLLAASELKGPARLRVVGWRSSSERFRCEAAAAYADPVGPAVSPAELTVARWPAPPPLIGHKTLSRLAWDLAAHRAQEAGADDAVLVTVDDQVLETSTANVWAVRGDAVTTPEAPRHALPGVMREWLFEHLGDLGVAVREGDLIDAELTAADEIWLSNAVVGVRRVGRIEDRIWHRWPLFDALSKLSVPAPGWPRRGW